MAWIFYNVKILFLYSEKKNEDILIEENTKIAT